MKIENNNKSFRRPVERSIIRVEEQKSFERKYWKFLNRLTPKEYIILALSLGGMNSKKQAEDLQVTKQNISRIKKNIAKKLENAS